MYLLPDCFHDQLITVQAHPTYLEHLHESTNCWMFTCHDHCASKLTSLQINLQITRNLFVSPYCADLMRLRLDMV